MEKSIATYAIIIVVWYLLMDAGVEPFTYSGFTWLAAIVVGGIFVVGIGIINAIKEKK